jgi:hypothetical protein
MKKIIALAVLCFLAVCMTASQNAISQTDSAVLKDFTRSGKIDGTTFNFVLLNDKTIELLFSAPAKYQIRAKANQATAFYVQGISDKNGAFSNKFVVEQNGETFDCESINIENFTGGNVNKGQKIKGILQLSKKIDLSHAFIIKASKDSVEFKLPTSAL